ncbi:MAG TPA: hypothetical protein ENJ00_08575 [Phycisphaerales bacterium]|nr:hypothetical protein [Phycisphaerales bacterium]
MMRQNQRSRFLPVRLSAALVCAAGLVMGSAQAAEFSTGIECAIAEGPTHEILLTNGQTVKVSIVKESPREVEVMVYVGNLSAPRTYQRSEIISITELSHSPSAEDDGAEASDESAVTMTRVSSSDADIPADAVKVFVIELKGKFGFDVSVTPVRKAMDRARELGADVVIVKCNNDWKTLEGFTDEKTDDEGKFEEYRFAEAIAPVFTTDTITKWEKEPQVVFWVERAMSGMAFLPMVKPDIYFTSDGRMGGVGDLDSLFDGVGDEVVRDKQKSLRLGHVEGMAIEGGHDPKLIRAMTRKSYVLSYRIVGGEPEYLEGEAPGWELLTDDGKDENADTDRDLVRGLGNDALTFTADLAKKLGVSKGTADTLDDLLFEMGIDDRAYILDDSDEDGLSDKGQRELEDWSQGIARAQQKLRRLQFDIANVEVRPQRNDPDGSKARNSARGKRLRLINEAIGLLNRYGEVLDPGEQLRVQLELQKQQIENEKRLERTRRGGGGRRGRSGGGGGG